MRRQRCYIFSFIHCERLDLQINAHDLLAAIFPDHPRALAKFRKTNVRTLTQFNAGSYENAVNLEARLPLKFKQNVDQAFIAGTAAQNPTPASQDRSGN